MIAALPHEANIVYKGPGIWEIAIWQDTWHEDSMDGGAFGTIFKAGQKLGHFVLCESLKCMSRCILQYVLSTAETKDRKGSFQRNPGFRPVLQPGQPDGLDAESGMSQLVLNSMDSASAELTGMLLPRWLPRESVTST